MVSKGGPVTGRGRNYLKQIQINPLPLYNRTLCSLPLLRGGEFCSSPGAQGGPQNVAFLVTDCPGREKIRKILTV